MFDKTKQRMQDAADDRVAKQMEGIRPDDEYHTIEVATWGDVKRFCNAMARAGWRLHTIRDGLRGNNIDMGYRLLFERSIELKEVQS